MKRSKGVPSISSKSRTPSTRVNSGIRAPQVRLIGANGEQIGIVSIQEALRHAENAGLDLVEVAPQNTPPVCKLIDYGRFKYIQQKQAQESKKKMLQVEQKEINLTPNISENDLTTKINHIEKWLEQKNRVKVSLRFRGREMSYQELGHKVLEKVLAALGPKAQIQLSPQIEGRCLIMVLVPPSPAKKK